jgi:hypothetical protein
MYPKDCPYCKQKNTVISDMEWAIAPYYIDSPATLLGGFIALLVISALARVNMEGDGPFGLSCLGMIAVLPLPFILRFFLPYRRSYLVCSKCGYRLPQQRTY